VVSYSDDTYVIIEGIDQNDTLSYLKTTLTSHINYLKSVGMVVNESKTELMWIGNTKHTDTVEINGKGSLISITHESSWIDNRK